MTVNVSYGIFNDPDVYEPRFAAGDIPEAMRPIILDTPLYEDNSLKRVVGHARITNEERVAAGKINQDGAVIVKRQVIMLSRWERVDPVSDALRDEDGVVPL